MSGATAQCFMLLQAFKGGRLLVRKMTCATPLTFPLEWRTGISEHGATVAGMDALVLVMNVGSYPVHLTARTSAMETDYANVSCPFQCSGVQARYSWEANTCWIRGQCDCGGISGTEHVFPVAWCVCSRTGVVFAIDLAIQ
jgi:hypothetical protein